MWAAIGGAQMRVLHRTLGTGTGFVAPPGGLTHEAKPAALTVRGIRRGHASSRRPDAPHLPRRGGGPVAPDRAGQGPALHDRGRPHALDDLLGASRGRQNHPGARDRPPHPRLVHRFFHGDQRHQGDPRGHEAGRRAGVHGQAHDRLRRRDSPLQQGPAGRVPSLRREGINHPHRRDHREPVLRGQQRPPVALQGIRPARPDRGGPGWLDAPSPE